ncbi:hypothetical protein [Rufibacter sp. XAAS-G3-1]|uniref:hypothetical protein n=1 Tax=Rufibacter sp. XAAS-G3-1 TaxID=2729134 RepID=UPI0015E67E3B|nr:hypothetical protein [Rufibacter sp. XAAS-G3-1]
MKTSFRLSFVLLLVTGSVASAQLPSRPEVYPKTAIASFPVKVPLVLINSQETYWQSLIVYESDVQVLQVYKNAGAVKPYGTKGQNGVVVAAVKGNPQLYRLSGVLDHFQVPAEQRRLKVLVNNRQVNPDYLLADIRQIQKVEVTKQDPTAPIRLSWNPDEEFLNIVTI